MALLMGSDLQAYTGHITKTISKQWQKPPGIELEKL